MGKELHLGIEVELTINRDGNLQWLVNTLEQRFENVI